MTDFAILLAIARIVMFPAGLVGILFGFCCCLDVIRDREAEKEGIVIGLIGLVMAGAPAAYWMGWI